MESTCRAMSSALRVSGALEHHVLDEMGDAVVLGLLVARAGLDPDPDGDRADVLHLLGDHSQTVGQDFAPDVAQFIHHKINAESRLGLGRKATA